MKQCCIIRSHKFTYLRLSIVLFCVILWSEALTFALNKSSFTCVGTAHQCYTNEYDKLKCNLEYSTNPFAPTICEVRRACLENNLLLLFDDSPISASMDGIEVVLHSQVRDLDIKLTFSYI